MEERSLVVRRIKAQRHRLKELKDAIIKDVLSTPEKIGQLREELAEHYQNSRFLDCKTMGEIMELHMRELIIGDLKEP
jgi:hypothetical protein